MFLFGARPGARDKAWLTQAIERALSKSDEFWCETPPMEELVSSPLLPELGVSSDRALTERLGAARAGRLRQVATDFGIEPENLQTLRPWVAAQLLSNAMHSQSELDPSLDVEDVLRNLAKQHGKVSQTEFSVEGILRAFAELPESVEIEYFDWTLDVIEKGPAHMEATYSAWLRGDLSLDEEDQLQVVSLYSAFYETLILARNHAWLPRMEKMLASGSTTFVAVGAGHVVGVDGIPRLARGAGIELRRVQ